MIEQIYNDFTTKLLPKVAEGFTITKEYFLDLFGRYAHFLFIQDLLYALISFVIFIVVLFFIVKAIKSKETHKPYSFSDGKDWAPWRVLVCIFGSMLAGFAFIFMINSTIDAIKDKYIPEVRIYEELKGFNK